MKENDMIIIIMKIKVIKKVMFIIATTGKTDKQIEIMVLVVTIMIVMTIKVRISVVSIAILMKIIISITTMA